MCWKKSLVTAKVPKVFENWILPGKFCGTMIRFLVPFLVHFFCDGEVFYK